MPHSCRKKPGVQLGAILRGEQKYDNNRSFSQKDATYDVCTYGVYYGQEYITQYAENGMNAVSRRSAIMIRTARRIMDAGGLRL